MPVGWFLSPYTRRLTKGLPSRYCVMDDFTTRIQADGGDWAETEVLGNHAVVKVRAALGTLQDIAAASSFQRLPKDRLDDALSDLPDAQKRAIRQTLESLGYPLDEIKTALGDDLGSKALRDVLRFATTRRLTPRYDAATDTIKVDGPSQVCRPIADVDRAVADTGPTSVTLLAWTSFLAGLYFGSGVRPARGVIDTFAQEAVRLGLTVEEHSYDYLQWMATHASPLLFLLFGAFPTTGVLDNFTGTNGTDLPAYSGNWVTLVGAADCEIQGNAATATVNAASNVDYWGASNFGPDSEAFFTLATAADSDLEMGVFLRLVQEGSGATADGYLCAVQELATDATGHYRLDNGAARLLGATIA